MFIIEALASELQAVIYRKERNSSVLESSNDIVPIMTFLTIGAVCGVWDYSLTGAHAAEFLCIMCTVNPKGAVDTDLTGPVIRTLYAHAVG
jgi:hypothetical protein